MTIGPCLSRRRNPTTSSETSDDEDVQLLETPADLLCPITHELFHEPVINAAGQVYERTAIEKALAHRLVDPISNCPLETASLTTVWPMKSKAAAYRERAVRGCIAQVCKPTCRAPIRYLRRAAELSAGAAALADPSGKVLGLPGLTRGVVDYVLTHPSSIYDFQALSLFAASLMASGHSDLAAGVYTRLLHLSNDSAQQVEALQALLACWGTSDEEDEQKLVERLAALSCREGPEGCRPARFVDVLLAAGLPEEVVVRFCEYILGGAGAGFGGASAASSSGRGSHSNGVEQAGNSGGTAAAQAGASGNADLLYVYTKLRCGRLDAALARRQASTGGGGGGAGPASPPDPDKEAVEEPQREGSELHRTGGSGKRFGLHNLKQRRVQRAVCSAVYALVSLTGSNRPLARVLKVASVLFLVNPTKQAVR